MSKKGSKPSSQLPLQPTPSIIPVPNGPIPRPPSPPVAREVSLRIDGKKVSVHEGTTLREAARKIGVETPTLCFLETLTPVSVCRVCVVEVEGSRTLAPACSRTVEEGMVVHTDSERVRLSRKLVLEFLASSVDVSTSPQIQTYVEQYGGKPERFGPRGVSSENERLARLEPPAPPNGLEPATVAQPVKADNELYIRDYAKCILCYKCVEACGDDAQNTFAIAVAARGFDARISTEYQVPLPDSACVYCGNCIGVCPTGALMFVSEYKMRQSGAWDETKQTCTDTICPYCGVGCTVTLHTQDQRIVKATSPVENGVTNGHLCIKGRFGWQFVQILPKGPGTVSGL